MAFDLVSYLRDQVKLNCSTQQKSSPLANDYLNELNCLSLGKLVDAFRQSPEATYKEIKSQDQLYIQHLARLLTTSTHNQTTVSHSEFEHDLTTILQLHIRELNQLDATAQLGQQGLAELLEGQIEHLSGQADDWVWSTNNLTQLIGSKKIVTETVSLEATLKEFNTMVHSNHTAEPTAAEQVDALQPSPTIPTWAKVAEPIVALIILWILYSAYCNYVA